jgi:hypothetical protein
MLLLAVLPVAAQDFYHFQVDQDRLSGAPDFSFLNHPLTAADRIFVRDGHFYRVGADLKPNTADDERVRFFGVNMAFGANFPEPADSVRIAKRLRRLGVNLVRCHHMDSSPDRDPQTANSLLTRDPYPTLNPISVARLRGFLTALAAEGIYANLNIHVGYTFRPEVDQVPPTPGIAFPTQSKPLHIFYPRMVELQAEYARKAIEALKLKGDPVLAMVEIDNETSMVEAWQRGNLDKNAVGEYRAELERQWKGPLVAWKDAQTNPHADDFLLFLSATDRAYMKKMLAAIRSVTDPLVPVTGTQMGYGGLMNLDSQADLDYQDNHFYIDHYNFPHKAWDNHDWRIRDSSAVGWGLQAFLNMAVTRVARQPYTVSEFNEPWPNRHAAEIDPLLAVFASFQDWDGIMHFAYSHGRNWDAAAPEGFDINGDWTKFPNIGQAAWIFRTAAVQVAHTSRGIWIQRDEQLRAGKSRMNSAQLLGGGQNALTSRTAIRKSDGPGGDGGGWGAERDRPDDFVYRSDRKVAIVRAPLASGAIGFVGKESVSAGAIDVQLTSGDFATVLATSLDGKPLADSTHILISTPGYTLGTVRGSNPPKRQEFSLYPGTTDWYTLGRDTMNAAPPAWMERVESIVTLHTNAKQMTVYPLDGAGGRMKPLAVKAVDGGFEFHLNADAPWYEVVTGSTVAAGLH